MDLLSFKEINFQSSKTQKTQEENHLDICIYNHYQNNIDQLVESVFENLSIESFNYRVTVLETANGREKLEVSTFVKKYPKVRLFLPANDFSISEAINLYVKESKANYILLLSGEFSKLEINVEKIGRVFQESQSIIGLAPKVSIDGKVVDTLYSLKPFQKRLFLSYDAFENNALTVKPFKMNLFFDRDKFLAVGGLDRYWNSFFLSNLDFGYRSYLHGHPIKMCDQFSIDTDDYNETYLEDFKPYYSSLNFALKCFKAKHFRDKSLWVNIVSLLLVSLTQFNFKWLSHISNWYKYRKQSKNQIRDNIDIVSMFR